MINFPKLQGFIIVDNDTGLASKGGMSPRWHKSPKVWGRMTDLKLHLQTQIHRDYIGKKIVILPYYMKRNVTAYDVVTQLPIDLDIKQYLRDKAAEWCKSPYCEKNNFTVEEL